MGINFLVKNDVGSVLNCFIMNFYRDLIFTIWSDTQGISIGKYLHKGNAVDCIQRACRRILDSSCNRIFSWRKYLPNVKRVLTNCDHCSLWIKCGLGVQYLLFCIRKSVSFVVHRSLFSVYYSLFISYFSFPFHLIIDHAHSCCFCLHPYAT